MKISKTFDFDAAHFLPLVAEDHKCRRLHGHTYRAELILEGDLDKRGMVCDYQDIADFWKKIDAVLDHRLLNEIPGLENPTTENLAVWILRVASSSLPIHTVRVFESSTTYAEATASEL